MNDDDELELTSRQLAATDLAIITMDEVFGEDLACTVLVHEIGKPWKTYIKTDGPVDELITALETAKRGLIP